MVGVVVVGSANVDLVTNAPRMAEPGETLMGTRFEQLFGGKGANQAVAAGLLGSSVAMVAKLGADSLGEGAESPPLLGASVRHHRVRHPPDRPGCRHARSLPGQLHDAWCLHKLRDDHAGRGERDRADHGR